MKQYTVEHIASLLEKAAAEIELKDAKIKELEEKLNQLESNQINQGFDFMEKNASYNSIDEEFGNLEDWGSLGEPSNVKLPSTDAKKALEDFLSSLA